MRCGVSREVSRGRQGSFRSDLMRSGVTVQSIVVSGKAGASRFRRIGCVTARSVLWVMVWQAMRGRAHRGRNWHASFGYGTERQVRCGRA